jgi:hypothetical protein
LPTLPSRTQPAGQLAQINPIGAFTNFADLGWAGEQNGGSSRVTPRVVSTLRDCWHACGPAQVRAGLADVCGGIASRVGAGSVRGWGCRVLGVGPAVMLGQHLADVAGPVGEGTVAELAADDRQVSDGHREAAGTWRTHRLPSCQPWQSDRHCMLTRTHDSRQKRKFTRALAMHKIRSRRCLGGRGRDCQRCGKLSITARRAAVMRSYPIAAGVAPSGAGMVVLCPVEERDGRGCL